MMLYARLHKSEIGDAPIRACGGEPEVLPHPNLWELTGAPVATPLRIDVLGRIRVSAGEQDLLPRGRKARALLAYLALMPSGGASRDQIADLLWTDRGAEQARGSLRQTVAEVRACGEAVSDAFVASRERIYLLPGSIVTDADLLLDAAQRREAVALNAALDDTGPLLDDLDGVAAGFDEWLAPERARQLDRVLAACLEALPAMIETTTTPTMQSILRSLDRLDPWNEAVARLGMRADHAAGDMASLHKRFRRLADGLKTEFEVIPSEETRLLFDRLTALAPVTAPARERTPPVVLVSAIEAIGADPEVAEIAAVVTDDIRVALAQHRDLRVLSLETDDLARVERVCDGAVAAYMLSGRLRRLGTDVRVNLQIGEVASSSVVWSEQLRVDADELAAAVDRVVARAAGALAPAIEHDLATRVSLDDLSGSDAATRFAKARRLVGRGRDIGQIRAGVAMLEALLADRPDHIGAALLLARLYNNDFWQYMAGHDVSQHRARALQLARHAAVIEPANARVRLRLAWCYLRQHDWARADQSLHAAIPLLMYDADGLNECAYALTLLGALDEADPLAQRAFLLNPFATPDYHADRGLFLMLRGDAVAAEESFTVLGERDLVYLAARLANMAVLDVDEAALARARDTFATAMERAWAGSHPATLDDTLDWIAYALPLKRDDHRLLVRTGLETALGKGWRASPNSAP